MQVCSAKERSVGPVQVRQSVAHLGCRQGNLVDSKANILKLKFLFQHDPGQRPFSALFAFPSPISFSLEISFLDSFYSH